jgi:hypothetical protein
MSTHGPIQSEYREKLNQLAAFLDDTLNGDEPPKRVGFVLLMFAFAEPDAARMNYISNADRADMLVALKELVANFEGRVMPDARNQ